MLNAANWTARLNELATEANVPGAALGIWSDGREVVAAHGVLNAATQVPVTTDSVFQVGSITKIWTATMIMQLVDEGLLSLDTTVSAVLPDARLGTADVGGQVTVRHLLTHTSGIDGDVFGDLTGVTMPPPPRPADGVPGSGSGPEASEMAGMKGAPGVADLGRYAGRYARTSRRFDVSVRDGRLAMELTMTGNLADLVGAEPEDLLLYPAECADSSGTRFVLRSRDDEPWAPVSFGQLADGTPYLYMSGRVAPRVS